MLSTFPGPVPYLLRVSIYILFKRVHLYVLSCYIWVEEKFPQSGPPHELVNVFSLNLSTCDGFGQKERPFERRLNSLSERGTLETLIIVLVLTSTLCSSSVFLFLRWWHLFLGGLLCIDLVNLHLFFVWYCLDSCYMSLSIRSMLSQKFGAPFSFAPRLSIFLFRMRIASRL